MQALKNELRKHRSTRSWVSADKPSVPELEDSERNLREGLQAQGFIADALLGYTDAVAGAFEALLQAHAALEEGGIAQVAEAVPTVKALIQCFRDAHLLTRSSVQDMQVPLEAHKASLMACFDDVTNADNAAAEVRYYDEKVAALTDDARRRNKVSARAEKRLERNREKLQAAQHSASVAKGCAQDSMGTCLSRHANLCELALKAVANTADALRGAAARLDACLAGVAVLAQTPRPAPAPIASLANGTSPFRSSSSGYPTSTTPRASMASENPFEGDIATSKTGDNATRPPAGGGVGVLPLAVGHRPSGKDAEPNGDTLNPFASDL
mmetsp:Transcript_21150/g.58648  ORF Transcript_21150/g.58648 Transcript_21150/m.58648 type:complete len:326 (-) Transcript_21150:262-1239(-)